MKRTTAILFIIFSIIFFLSISKINAEETPSSEVSPPLDTPTSEDISMGDGTQSVETPSLTTSATDTDQSPYESMVTSSINVQPSGNIGAAVTSIPIVVPSGRNGIAPNLSLTYNSSNGNGHLGVGWSLDVGSIQRNTKRGVCYECDDYVAFINGSSTELVKRTEWDAYCSSGQAYGAKIEGSFARFCKTSSNSWEVTTKNGIKYFYGRSSASRQDFESGVKIFKWCLDRVEDTNGNYMEITYIKDDGDIYIYEIKYTGNSSLLPTNIVRFGYEGRTDNHPLYITNYKVATNLRLTEISTFAKIDQLSRRYLLEYVYSTRTSRSLLTGITVFGSDNSTSLPKITFTYQQGATGFSNTTYESGAIANIGVPPSEGGSMAWVDFNGDGLADFCRVIYPQGVYKLACRLAEIDSSGNLRFASSDITSNEISKGYTSKSWVDFNGDGRADYCRLYDKDNHKLACTLSNGNSFGVTIETPYTLPDDWEYPGGRWMDFNGDGKTDYCYMPGTIIRCILSKGNSFAPLDQIISYTIPPPNAQQVRNKTIRGADVNGDGRSDFCWVTDDNILKCILSKGDSFGNIISKNISYIDEDRFPFWADVNGDGKMDACVGNNINLCSAYPYDCRNRCFLSTGNGFGDIYYYTYEVADSGRQFAEFNGDGKAEFCGVDNDSGNPKCLRIKEGLWYIANTGGGEEDGGRQWADFNGDGKADYCRRTNDKTVKCTTALSPSNAAIDDLLIGITNGIGAQTTIRYRPSSAYVNDYLPFIIQTVSSVTINDGNGNVSTTEYDYAYGYFDPAEREFRGFEYLRTKNPAENGIRLYTETWFYTGYDPQHTITDEDRLKGAPIDQIISDSLGNVYTRTAYTYDIITPYSNTYFPRLKQKDEYIFDGSAQRNDFNTDAWKTKQYKLAKNTYNYDSYGNIQYKYFYHGDNVTAPIMDWYEYNEYYTELYLYLKVAFITSKICKNF